MGCKASQMHQHRDARVHVELGRVDTLIEKELLESCRDLLDDILVRLVGGPGEFSKPETAESYLLKQAEHDSNFESTMQRKDRDWKTRPIDTWWEVMTDFLLQTTEQRGVVLLRVLGNDFSSHSKYEVAMRLLRHSRREDSDFELDLKATNRIGQTLLHLAFQCRFDESEENVLVETFISLSPDVVNVKDKLGTTPLLTAISEGCRNHDLIRKMVEVHGADVNAVDRFGCNVLHLAARNGNHEMVAYFIRPGRLQFNFNLVNAKDNCSCTPLHAAAENGSVECVEYLLIEVLLQGNKPVSYGRWVADGFQTLYAHNAVNSTYHTALHLAAMSRQSSVRLIEFLIIDYDDVNKVNLEGRTALHLAAKQGGKDVVGLLIKRGGDVNLKDLKGHTPLDIAEEKNDSLAVYNLLYEPSFTCKMDRQQRITIADQLNTMMASGVPLQDDSVASEIREMSHNGVVEMMMKKQWHSTSGNPGELKPGQFVNNFIETFVKSDNFQETTRAMLDKVVLGKKRVNCEVFDADSMGNLPDHKKFNPRTAPLLAAIVETNNTKLALYPAVKAVVDHKWKTFFWKIFTAYFVFHLVRTSLFIFALLIAARPDRDNPGCYSLRADGWDVVRGILEGLTLIFFVVEILYILFELKVLQICSSQSRRKTYGKDNLLRILAVVLPLGIIPFRAATTWCASTGVGYRALPVVNNTVIDINSTDINVPCIVAASHVQWIVAALAYLFNAILILEFLATFKRTGVYVQILIRIVKTDILKFSILYLVFLLAFVLFFYFVLRGGVVITSDGQLISDVKLFAPDVPYPVDILLFGVRMLKESGGISRGYFTDDDNSMYNGYQWFLVIIYTTILLFMSVVLLSLLISQMSNSYSRVQKDAKGTFALAKARVVVRLQKQLFFTIFLLSKLDKKKKFYKDYISIGSEETKPRVKKMKPDSFSDRVGALHPDDEAENESLLEDLLLQ